MCDYPALAEDYCRVARKDHKCEECGDLILKSDIYWYHKGLVDGHFYEFKECIRCSKVRGILSKLTDEECFGSLGCLKEDFSELCRDITEFPQALKELLPPRWLESANEGINYRNEHYDHPRSKEISFV